MEMLRYSSSPILGRLLITSQIYYIYGSVAITAMHGVKDKGKVKFLLKVSKDGLLDRKSFLELAGADHLFRLHPFVELRLSKVAKLECGLLESQAFLVGVLGNRGGFVISNVRVECSHQHERVVHQLIDALGVGCDAGKAVLHEGLGSVAQQTNGVEHVVGDEWLEDVQLEVSAEATDSHCSLIAHNLSANHSHCLALGGIHLAGHDAGPGLILRKVELAQSASRTTAQESDIIGDLEETDSDSVKRTMEVHECVLGGKRLELVEGSDEMIASFLADLLGNCLGKTNVSI